MEKVEVNTNLEYSRRKLADLKEYEGNARTHNKEQIMQIANSMMENGWTAPMLIDENDMILAGHGRKAAGEMLGVEEVPVMIIRGLNPAQKARLCISENQIALNAGWDTNKLSEQLQLILDDGLDLEICPSGQYLLWHRTVLRNKMAQSGKNSNSGKTGNSGNTGKEKT